MNAKSILLFSLLLVGITACIGRVIDNDCEAFDIKRLPDSHKYLKESFTYLYNNEDTLVFENTSRYINKAINGPLMAPCEPNFYTQFKSPDKVMRVSYSWSYYPNDAKDSVKLRVSINSEDWVIPLNTDKFHEDSIIFLNNNGKESLGPDHQDRVYSATLVDFIVAEIYMTSGDMWELVED